MKPPQDLQQNELIVYGMRRHIRMGCGYAGHAQAPHEHQRRYPHAAIVDEAQRMASHQLGLFFLTFLSVAALELLQLLQQHN